MSVTGETLFSWAWEGPDLTSNQGFEVRIWREGQADHYGAAEPVSVTSTQINVDTAFGVAQGGPGVYLWTVALVQLNPYERIGPEAMPRALLVQ